jgi:hypothetical protein
MACLQLDHLGTDLKKRKNHLKHTKISNISGFKLKDFVVTCIDGEHDLSNSVFG